MTDRVRERWRQLGSIDAVSWPVFWLTLVAGLLGLAVHNVSHYGLATRLTALLLGQAALWAPLVVARVILTTSPVSRPVLVVLSLFAGLAARVAVVGWVFSQASSVAVQWTSLYLGALTNVGFVFVVSAIVVATARERRRQILALRLAQKGLSLATEQATALLTQRNEVAIERVRAILLAEVDQLDVGNARDSLAALQRAVGDVVRPLSREIEGSIPTLEVAKVDEPITASWREVVDAAATGRPFRPMLTAALLSIELTAATAILPAGAVIFALSALWCAIAFAVVNVILAPVLERSSVTERVCVVVGAALVVGAVTTLGLAYLLPATQTTLRLSIAVGCFLVILSLTTAIASSAVRDRARTINDLEAASFALTCNLVRCRQVQWFQQKSLSRALHGPVQTALAVAAIRLGIAIREGADPSGLVVSLRSELLASLDVLDDADRPIGDLGTAFARIQSVWDGVCIVGAYVDEEAATLIDTDPVARSVLIDLAAEAVSNAVRHADAARADIAVGLVWEESVPVIELGVHADGSADVSTTVGLGTRMLDDCALSWSLDVASDGTLLAARVPVLETPRGA